MLLKRTLNTILNEIFTWMLNIAVEQIVERDIERILEGIFTRILKREVQQGIEPDVGQHVQLQIIRQEISVVELQNTTTTLLTSVIRS